MDYTALWAEIQANPACAPYITPSEPKVSSEIARANDQTIADILNVGRTRRVSRMITERGIREALPIKDASVFLRALRELSTATEIPPGIAELLTAAGVDPTDHWAYFETLQCGWGWLKSEEGLDIGSQRVIEPLQLIGGGIIETSPACVALAKLSIVEDHVTAADVSRAVRGPRE